MSRPRKPTAALELSGALKHDPKRYADRADEPKPTASLGNAPPCLSPEEKKVWAELRRTVFWLTNADRQAVEMLCELIVKRRSGTITAGERGVMMNLFVHFGMTPADRSKVQAAPKKPHGEAPGEGWAMFTNPAKKEA